MMMIFPDPSSPNLVGAASVVVSRTVYEPADYPPVQDLGSWSVYFDGMIVPVFEIVVVIAIVIVIAIVMVIVVEMFH
jgi:hypothetical protein